MTGCVRSALRLRANFSDAYVTVRHPDRTQPLCVRLLLRLAFDHLTETARYLLALTGRAGPAEASVRSLTVTPSRLRFFTELILINSNFFSFTNVPTPQCVCVLAFHKHFPKD